MLVRTAGESANENEHAKSSPKRPNGSRPRRLIQDEESEEEEDRLAGEEVVMQAAAASACIRPTPAYASLPAAMVTEAAPEEQEEEEEEEENVAVGKSALRGVGPMQTAINKTNAAASSSLSSSQMLSHSSINPLMYKERRRHLLQQLVDGGLESAEEHEGVESVARNLGSNRPDSQHGGGQEYAGSRSDSQHGGDDDDHSNLLGVNDRIIMAVSYRKKKLGCCYYSLLEKKIQMLEDVLETDQLEVLHLLLMQVKPDVIITSSRCDERMVQFIEHIIREEAELCGAGASDLTTLEIKPSSEFTISNGKARLLSVIESLNAAPSSSSVNNNRYFPDKTDNLLHLESIVSSDKTEMVGCCGALLNYISKLQIEQEDGDIRIGHALSSDYRVIGLNQFAVSQFMQINADTLRFL